MPTQARLKEMLNYDPETGVFRWIKKPAQRVNVGDVAGYENGRGYLIFCLDSKKHYAHRLAWLYCHGQMPPCIDHKNGCRSDNRLENLRIATNGQNGVNRGKPANNTSGFKGVTWDNQCQKWRAQIGISGKNIAIGVFADKRDACAAYETAAREHFGEFARAA